MKLVKKFLTGLTLAATASLSVQAQTVTLDVLYCYPSFARFHEPLAAEYMKQNPNVKIQFRAPSASYARRIGCLAWRAVRGGRS